MFLFPRAPAGSNTCCVMSLWAMQCGAQTGLEQDALPMSFFLLPRSFFFCPRCSSPSPSASFGRSLWHVFFKVATRCLLRYVVCFSVPSTDFMTASLFHCALFRLRPSPGQRLFYLGSLLACSADVCLRSDVSMILFIKSWGLLSLAASSSQYSNVGSTFSML